MGLPPVLSVPLLRTAARLAGFRLRETTAADSVRGTDLPILNIHGEDDRFVPAAMSAEIQQANPAIRRHTFPAAGHGISYMKDTPRYHRLVTEFITEVLSSAPKK